MATEEGGQTEQPQKEETVEIANTAEDLAEVLKAMELEEVPTEIAPNEAPAEAAAEEGEKPEDVPTEPEEATEEEAEAEPTVDESAEVEQADNLPRGVQKRIDKLTARSKAKDEELEAKDGVIKSLKGQLEEAGEKGDAPPPSVSDPSNPFRHLKTAEEVQREELKTESVMDWCEDHMEGSLVSNSDGTESEYTAEDVREIRKKARRALSRQLPAQREWINEHNAAEPYANESFTWWKDKASSEYQAAVAVMKEFPEVQRFSGFKISIGDMIEGMKLRLNKQQAAKGKGKKKAPPKAPEQPSAPAAEPAPVDLKTARSASARQRLNATGSVDDLVEIMKTYET